VERHCFSFVFFNDVLYLASSTAYLIASAVSSVDFMLPGGSLVFGQFIVLFRFVECLSSLSQLMSRFF